MGDSALPRLLLTAPASGHGKTTITIALLRALLDNGVRPAAFKCGPDYIDPLFHREALGVTGYNLDLFFSTPDDVRGLLRRGGENADIAVLEGAMGMYDGVGGTATASAWEVAAATETPVVFILRPKGAFLSLAALVNGFRDFRPDSRIAGIIFNQCPAVLHDRLAPVILAATRIPSLGFVPDVPEAYLASRHLGLVTPGEADALDGKIQALAAQLRQGVDLDALLAVARSAPPLATELPAPPREHPCRIAVARDEAFCFYYRDNLELLEALGARLVYFSPLRDSALPGDVDGLYLGGGYPEVHAGQLAANAGMRNCIARAVASGLPTLAECGGFLYLQQTMEDGDGDVHPMCGALPGHGLKGTRLRRFGYVTLTTRTDSLLGSAGTVVKGHEFHYWDSSDCGDACRAEKASGGQEWACVHATPTLFAGFPHLSFRSNPGAAAGFVRAAARHRDGERRT